MKLKIIKQLDVVDKQLHQLVSRLSRYSEGDLNRKPSEKEWSVMQVMCHLKLAELYGIQYMQKKLSGDRPLKKTTITGKIMPALYPLFFSIPVRFNAPEPVADDHLPVKSSFWEVTKEWKKQREFLRSYINTLSDEQLKSEIYRHPVFGRSNAAAMLRFYKLHTARHEKQINRLLSYYKV